MRKDLEELLTRYAGEAHPENRNRDALEDIFTAHEQLCDQLRILHVANEQLNETCRSWSHTTGLVQAENERLKAAHAAAEKIINYYRAYFDGCEEALTKAVGFKAREWLKQYGLSR